MEEKEGQPVMSYSKHRSLYGHASLSTHPLIAVRISLFNQTSVLYTFSNPWDRLIMLFCLLREFNHYDIFAYSRHTWILSTLNS
jgi:hypothetical protein